MSNEFDQYYTVEFFGSKGWEVYFTTMNYHDAIAELKDCLNDKKYQWRLTTPKIG